MPVQIKVVSESTQARADLLKVEKSLKSVEASANQISGAVNNATSAIAFSAILAPLALMAKGAINMASTFETLDARLVTVTGSAQKAGVAFDTVKKLILETPFAVKALTDSYARLAATGSKTFKTNANIAEGVRAISDAVAAIGGGDLELTRVSVAFERMSAEGRITAERLNQLAEAGIPLTKIADTLGLTMGELRAESEKGTFSFEKFYKAFVAVSKAADGFAGAAARQNNTIKGAASNFSDAIELMSDRIVRGSGLNRIFIRSLQRNGNAISRFTADIDSSVRLGLNKFVRFQSDIIYLLHETQDLLSSAGGLVYKLVPRISFNAPDWVMAIKEKFSKLKVSISPLFSLNVESIGTFMRKLAEKARTLSDGIEPVAIRLKLPSLNLSEFMPGLDSVGKQIAGFGSFVKGVFFNIWDEVVGHSTWPDLIDGVTKWSNKLGPQAVPGVQKFGDGVLAVFNELTGGLTLADKLTVAFASLGTKISFYFGGNGEKTQQERAMLGMAVGIPIMLAISAAFSALAGVIATNVAALLGFSAVIAAVFISLANFATWAYVKLELLQNLNPKIRLKDFIPDLEQVKSTIHKFGMFVKGVFFSIWDEVVGHSTWPDLIEGVIDWSSELLSGVKPYMDKFFNYVSGMFLKLGGLSESIKLDIKTKASFDTSKGSSGFTLFFKTIEDKAIKTASFLRGKAKELGVSDSLLSTTDKLTEATRGLNKVDFAAASVVIGALGLLFRTSVVGKVGAAVGASAGGAALAHQLIGFNFGDFTDKIKASFSNAFAGIGSLMTPVGDALVVVILAAFNTAFRKLAFTVVAVKFAISAQGLFDSPSVIAAVEKFGAFVGRVIVDAISNKGQEGLLALVTKLFNLVGKFGNSILKSFGGEGNSSGIGLIVGLLFGTAGVAVFTGNVGKTLKLLGNLATLLWSIPFIGGKKADAGGAGGAPNIIERKLFGVGGVAGVGTMLGTANGTITKGLAKVSVGLAGGLASIAASVGGGLLADKLISALGIENALLDLSIRIAGAVGGTFVANMVIDTLAPKIVAGLVSMGTWAGLGAVALTIAAAIGAGFLAFNLAEAMGIESLMAKSFIALGAAAAAAWVIGFRSAAIASAIVEAVAGPGLLVLLRAALARLALGTLFMSALIPGAAAIGGAIATFLATLATGLSLPFILAAVGVIAGIGLIGALLFGDVNGTGPLDRVKKFVFEMASIIGDFFTNTLVNSVKGSFEKIVEWLRAKTKSTYEDPLLFPNGAPAKGAPTNIRLFSTGGHVSGAGSGTSDSIPAMLSNGEFVVKASVAGKFRGFLERLNSGDVPGFAQGGSPWAGRTAQGPMVATVNANSSAPIRLEIRSPEELFEVALNLEGATKELRALSKAIYQQESGSGKNTATSHAGAMGGMQIMPDTFNSVADSGWNIKDPLDNSRAGIRYAKQMLERANGDMKLAAAGYYSGPGGMDRAKAGIHVYDPKSAKAPSQLQYGDQVATRASKLLGKEAQEIMGPPITAMMKLSEAVTDTSDTFAEFSKRRALELEDIKYSADWFKKPAAPAPLDTAMPRFPEYSLENRLQKMGFAPENYDTEDLDYSAQSSISKMLSELNSIMSKMSRAARAGREPNAALTNAYTDTANMVQNRLNPVKKPDDWAETGNSASPEARLAGKEFFTKFQSEFQQGLASLLKGKISIKSFLMSALDQFTSSIIDTFTTSLTQRFLEASGLKSKIESVATGVFGFGEKSGVGLATSLMPAPIPTVKVPFPEAKLPTINGGVPGLFDETLDSLSDWTSTIGAKVGSEMPIISSAITDSSDKAATSIFSSFSGAMSKSEGAAGNFGGAVMNVFGSLGKGASSIFGSVLQALSSSSGGGGGLFSSIVSGAMSLFGDTKMGLGYNDVGPRFAEGGSVSGPGTGTSDSIPAMLSNGEFVVNAKASSKYRGLLSAINTNRVSRFAAGGAVGDPVSGMRSADSIEVAKGGSTTNQSVNLNITGDISRQTKSEIFKLLPSIAEGVNAHNREKGYKG